MSSRPPSAGTVNVPSVPVYQPRVSSPLSSPSPSNQGSLPAAASNNNNSNVPTPSSSKKILANYIRTSSAKIQPNDGSGSSSNPARRGSALVKTLSNLMKMGSNKQSPTAKKPVLFGDNDGSMKLATPMERLLRKGYLVGRTDKKISLPYPGYWVNGLFLSMEEYTHYERTKSLPGSPIYHQPDVAPIPPVIEHETQQATLHQAAIEKDSKEKPSYLSKVPSILSTELSKLEEADQPSSLPSVSIHPINKQADALPNKLPLLTPTYSTEPAQLMYSQPVGKAIVPVPIISVRGPPATNTTIEAVSALQTSVLQFKPNKRPYSQQSAYEASTESSIVPPTIDPGVSLDSANNTSRSPTAALTSDIRSTLSTKHAVAVALSNSPSEKVSHIMPSHTASTASDLSTLASYQAVSEKTQTTSAPSSSQKNIVRGAFVQEQTHVDMTNKTTTTLSSYQSSLSVASSSVSLHSGKPVNYIGARMLEADDDISAVEIVSNAAALDIGSFAVS